MNHRWKRLAFLFAATGGCFAAWAQIARKPADPDQLYTNYVRAQHDFLTLDPALERDLFTVPADKALERIERSRKAAEIHSQAKIAYYEELYRKSEGLLGALQSATGRPAAQLLEQMRQRRRSLAENESDANSELEKLRAQRIELATRSASAAEMAQLDALIVNAEQDRDAIRKAKFSVEQGLASADQSQEAAKEVQPALNRWKAIQEENQKHYETLFRSAQQQATLWDLYHRDLKQIVVEHNGRNGK